MIQFIKKFFNRRISEREYTTRALKRLRRLSRAGKVKLYFGNEDILRAALYNSRTIPFILIVHDDRVQSELLNGELRTWFRNYKI